MLTLLSCGQNQNGVSIIIRVNSFNARVVADGGFFESRECLILSLYELQGSYSKFKQILELFEDRVFRDEGSYESQSCLEDTLIKLNV